MLCSNGWLGKPQGENGLYFLCQLENNKDNPCKFVKWCTRLYEYQMSTSQDGFTCPDYSVKKIE